VADSRLSCMVRDPYWIYCYWDVACEALETASRGRGPSFFETVRWVLRVKTGDDEPREIEIDSKERSAYLKVRPGTRCRVQLGLVAVGGEFLALVPGEEVETPPEPMGEMAARDLGPMGLELERLMEQGLVGSSASSFSSMSGVPASWPGSGTQ
jgi:hypothetical protein